MQLRHLLSPMCRPSCGQANTYNVEQFEKMRDKAMTLSQDSPAAEDGTAAQDAGKGISVLIVARLRRIHHGTQVRVGPNVERPSNKLYGCCGRV